MNRELTRNKNFMFVIVGQTASKMGTVFSGFAIPWLVLELTNSALQVGILSALSFVPYILISLPAGVWADRYDRKKLMVLSDICRMILIGLIPLTSLLFHRVFVWELYIIQAGIATCAAVFDGSFMSSIPKLVNRADLRSANAMIQSGFSLSQVLGIPIAGVLVSAIGAAQTIAFDSLTYLVSICGLLLMKIPLSANPNSDGHKRKSMVGDLKEALQFVWGNQLLKTIGIITFIGNIGSGAMGVVLLYRLKEELHLGSHWSSLVMACMGAGAFVASLVAVIFSKRFNGTKVMVVMSFFEIIPPIIIAIARNPIVLGAAVFSVGLLGVLWNVLSLTLRQTIIPNNLLGRASSGMRMTSWASVPIGRVVGGGIAQSYGASLVFVGVSGLLLISWLVFFLSSTVYKFDSKAAVADS